MVRDRLAAGQVLVEITVFRPLDFHRAETDLTDPPARGVAWIIPATNEGEVSVIDLGEWEPIYEAVMRFREGMSACPLTIRTDGEPAAEAQKKLLLRRIAELNSLA
jgi:hypothetical protein